jgi:cell shape-determining protein MreD
MTAVLGRGGLLAVVLTSLLWTAYGPQGAWKPAWVLLVAVVVSCAVPAWIALQPDNERGGNP